jgi:acyl-CoA thioester hydrolase
VSLPFKFSTSVKVRFNETDLQGHVNFGQFYFYFDVGLTEYLEAIGYDYSRLLAEGADMVYVESHCRYLSPARWPEVLRVHTRMGHIGRRSLRFEFEVRAQADERKVAEGHIAAATVVRGSFDPLPVPEALRRAAGAFEQVSFEAPPPEGTPAE